MTTETFSALAEAATGKDVSVRASAVEALDVTALGSPNGVGLYLLTPGFLSVVRDFLRAEGDDVHRFVVSVAERFLNSAADCEVRLEELRRRLQCEDFDKFMLTMIRCSSSVEVPRKLCTLVSLSPELVAEILQWFIAHPQLKCQEFLGLCERIVLDPKLVPAPAWTSLKSSTSSELPCVKDSHPLD